MIQVYADGVLVYAPGIDEYALEGLTVMVSVDKAGTAAITMPATHPELNSFISHRTEVAIYRAGELLFRGRALYPADDIDGSRTITCEGERCFLRDAVLEPYLYQADPAVIFSDIIAKYNAQVDDFKRFHVGAITVTDPNGYVRMEREDAEQVSDAIDALVERVGGYITFTTDSDGRRTINWLAELSERSGQTVEFGENLLDYARSDANPDLATVIYPYGAKDETTGKRLNIAGVNGGKLYIKDDAAVAVRGWIARPVYWDDVTLPANLLSNAKKYLATSKLVTTTLELSAVDLSIHDKSIDTMRAGDNVRVLSKPHGVDDWFLIRERTYDLLDPSQDKVVLGKELTTLTGLSVSKDKNTAAQIRQTTSSVTNNYNIFTDGDAYSPSNPPSYPVTSVNGMTGAVNLAIPKLGALQYTAPWDETQKAFVVPLSQFSNPADATNASWLAFSVKAAGELCIIGDNFITGTNLYIRAYSLSGEPWGTGEMLNILYLTK